MTDNFRRVQGTRYRDYIIVVNPKNDPAGRLKDCFSIHQTKEGDDWAVIAYSRTVEEATDYPSETEATEAALKHAGTWIDAQHPQGDQGPVSESR